MGETETVAAEGVVAFGDFVLDLQGISDDGLSRAIFVVRRLLRGLKPRGVLLADFHYSLRERCHDERFGDFTPQLAGAIVHFGLAHRGLRLGDTPGQLGSAPKRKLLLDAISKVAVLGRIESARAIDTATEHRDRVFPSAHGLRVEGGRADSRVRCLQRGIVCARLCHESIDQRSRDDDGVGRFDRSRVIGRARV